MVPAPVRQGAAGPELGQPRGPRGLPDRRCGSGPTAASTASGSTSPTRWPRTCPSRCRTRPTLDQATLPLDGSRPARTTATRCTRSTPSGARSSTSTTRRGPRSPRPGSHASRRARYASPQGLGQAFNFDLLQADFDAAQFRRDHHRQPRPRPRESGRVVDLGALQPRRRPARHPLRPARSRRHDQDGRPGCSATARRRCSTSSCGLRRARAATLLMLALPGSGLPVPGRGARPARGRRPAGRRAAGPDVLPRRSGVEKGRDGCRVPLPWTVDGPSFGFGAGGAHLPQPAWFGPQSVAAQDDDPSSTLSLYRRALALRRKLQATEELEWVETRHDAVLHFRRPGGWESITNFGTEPVALPPGAVLSSGPLTDAGALPPDTTAWIS